MTNFRDLCTASLKAAHGHGSFAGKLKVGFSKSSCLNIGWQLRSFLLGERDPVRGRQIRIHCCLLFVGLLLCLCVCGSSLLSLLLLLLFLPVPLLFLLLLQPLLFRSNCFELRALSHHGSPSPSSPCCLCLPKCLSWAFLALPSLTLPSLLLEDSQNGEVVS